VPKFGMSESHRTLQEYLPGNLEDCKCPRLDTVEDRLKTHLSQFKQYCQMWQSCHNWKKLDAQTLETCPSRPMFYEIAMTKHVGMLTGDCNVWSKS